MPQEYAVLVDNLVKIYEGGIEALKGISFKVLPGEVFGIIGPNGAGKTTLMRIMATLLKPTSGTVRILGYDVVKEPEQVRKVISYLPEEAGAYPSFTGFEYLEFMAKFYTDDKEEIKVMIEDAKRICGLGDRLRDRIKSYSKGMLRRLLVARALMIRPRVALLDEPTSGLDVLHAMYIRNIIREYAKKFGITVLLSSHNMLEVEYLCDRVAILNKGQLIAEGRPEELKEIYSASNLEEVFARAVTYERFK
ncbi:MAG: multidrug ABC transporter ATP-binding protein [Thermoprotei archaeon]|nr:MAG: multidrug ABC transporter ATP-binding protein [Thermoprotei archaeon]RLF20345.1 MAG: multidrug ABC transporter ATP-binding protein [Thermoprotei archaeon]